MIESIPHVSVLLAATLLMGIGVLFFSVRSLLRIIVPAVRFEIPLDATDFHMTLPKSGHYEIAAIYSAMTLLLDRHLHTLRFDIRPVGGGRLDYFGYSRWNMFSGQRSDFSGRMHFFIGRFDCAFPGDYLITLRSPAMAALRCEGFSISSAFPRVAFACGIIGTFVGATLALGSLVLLFASRSSL